VTPEQIVATIKYLIAEMQLFKSTDTHKLEFQLAMLFRPPGGYVRIAEAEATVAKSMFRSIWSTKDRL
jgi:hypothetical protein